MSVRKREWISASERQLAALERREPKKQTAWVVDYKAFNHKDREWKRKQRTFPQRGMAENWLDENIKDIKRKIYVADKTTVQEACARWIETVTHGRRDRGPAVASTLRQYRYLTDFYIVPELGSKKLCDLITRDVQDFKTDLLRRVSRSLTRKCIIALNGILSEAVDQNMIAVNVAAQVRVGPDGAEREKVTIPEIAEVKAILAELNRRAVPGSAGRPWRRYRAIIAFAIHSGMRASEIRGLPWIFLDLQEGKVHVRQRADENGTVAKVTKTKAGYRTIALPADLIQLLREWKMEAGGHALVFATKHGKPVSLANITRHGWYPVQLAVGTDHNFHSLRHFHASMLIADGANPKDVQVEIGHANIQFTYNRYGHLFQDDEANRRRSERSERMASLLSPVRGI